MTKQVLKSLVLTVPMLAGILAPAGGMAAGAGTPYTALGDSLASGVGGAHHYGYVSVFCD